MERARGKVEVEGCILIDNCCNRWKEMCKNMYERNLVHCLLNMVTCIWLIAWFSLL